MSYTLQNVAARRRKHPGEFPIPSASVRRSLPIGSRAELVVLGRDRSGRPAGERVWVDITRAHRSGYAGRVDRSGRLASPRSGQIIRFGPDHILSVARANPVYDRGMIQKKRGGKMSRKPKGGALVPLVALGGAVIAAGWLWFELRGWRHVAT